jgi:hypothetical protein
LNTIDTARPATGRAVVSNADDPWFSDIAFDGAGGALLMWPDEHDPRSTSPIRRRRRPAFASSASRGKRAWS